MTSQVYEPATMASQFEPPAPMVRTTKTIGGNAAFHNFHNDYSHIPDPNERRRLALSEIDKVPFGWYHVRAVVVAGIGFFTDSYDIFAINLVSQMIGLVFFQDHEGTIPTGDINGIKVSASIGAVLGQVFFGWLADKIGRRVMYGIELGIIIFATLAQSLTGPSPSTSITSLLIFWRIVMGFGIGGDYPMSSVITSEFAPTKWRGGMMAAVFSMQGAGQFAAAFVALIVTIGFKDSFVNIPDFASCDLDCRKAADDSWRIVVGFGAIPACFALYYRITIPETPRYTFDVAHDVEKGDADIQAFLDSSAEGHPDALLRVQQLQNSAPTLSRSQPKATLEDFMHYFGAYKNGIILVGTASTWFILDFAYYGLGLNNSSVLETIGYSKGPNVYETLYNTAVGNLILVCAGSIPGYWLTVLTVDTIGRRPIQIFGFLFLTVIFCIIGFAFHRLPSGGLLALYILAQLFFNFGPNSTTFIIPGECYPTRYRSTAHGLSAASGKIGAIISQFISIPVMTRGAPENCSGSACNPWLNHLMEIYALVMLIGTLVSILCTPETRRLTLEELAGEEKSTDFRAGGGAGGGMVGISKPDIPQQLSFWKRLVSSPLIRGPGVGVLVVPDRSSSQIGIRKREMHSRSGSRGTVDGYPTSMSDADSIGHIMSMSAAVHVRSDSIPLQDVGSLLGRKADR